MWVRSVGHTTSGVRRKSQGGVRETENLCHVPSQLSTEVGGDRRRGSLKIRKKPHFWGSETGPYFGGSKNARVISERHQGGTDQNI
jgi:hypothetical protein